MDLLDDEGLLGIGRRAKRTDPAQAIQEIRGRRGPTPTQNEALRNWTAPAKADSEGCHLCGRTPRLLCNACGRPACSADSWIMLALCRTCATEERMKAAHGGDASENWLA